MRDWRRYTGTQFLQAIWTLFALAVGAVVQLFEPIVDGLLHPAVFLTGSGIWIVGLFLIALYDRRHWNQMVADSSFKPDTSTRLADLERLQNGRTVVVTTNIPDIFSQTHMTVRTPVEAVDATFTVQLTHVGTGGRERGLQTGNDQLDEAFVIRGTEQTVVQLLPPEIQETLVDIETAGVFTITGDAVECEIPFTRLSVAELEAVTDACVDIAERIEAVPQR
jgi:hypothetical protein